MKRAVERALEKYLGVKKENIKLNNKMKKELNSLGSKANNVIDLSLLKLLKDGFILSNGCTFLRFLFEKAHVSFTDFSDMTGYEQGYGVEVKSK